MLDTAYDSADDPSAWDDEGNEDLDDDPSAWDDEGNEDLDDDYDPDCSLYFDRSGRVWTCGQIGSEFCDFSCPHRQQIGQRK